MIEINIDPNLISTGGFLLSWHGFFSFIAVATAVLLVARWAKREGIVSDVVYSTAIWAILGGIVGARLGEALLQDLQHPGVDVGARHQLDLRHGLHAGQDLGGAHADADDPHLEGSDLGCRSLR